MWLDKFVLEPIYDSEIKPYYYDSNNIKNILNNLSNDIKHNKDLITNNLDLNYVDVYGRTLLNLFVDELYDVDKVLNAIVALLELGLSPNLEDNQGYNFIQTALYTGYSEEFILNLIKLSFTKGLDVNHRDSDGDTIVHTAIYSEVYKGNIIPIYNTLASYGFDHEIKDKKGKNIFEALRITDEDIGNKVIPDKEEMIRLLLLKGLTGISYKKFKSKNFNNNEDYNWLSQYGNFTEDNKELKFSWININNEVLYDNRIYVICGKSGVGKTSYLNTLMNKLTNDNYMVFRTSYDKILSSCNSIGNFYNTLYKIMRKCAKNDWILLFDDFDKIYRENLDEEEKEEIDCFIEMYTCNKQLKLITTIDINNKEFISSGLLKNKIGFNYIVEPDITIINKYIDNEFYKLNYTIDLNLDKALKELIIEIINDENINDEHKNISSIKIVSELIKDIINYNNNEKNTIEIDNIIYAINMCKFITLDSKTYLLEKLNNVKENKKILIIKK